MDVSKQCNFITERSLDTAPLNRAIINAEIAKCWFPKLTTQNLRDFIRSGSFIISCHSPSASQLLSILPPIWISYQNRHLNLLTANNLCQIYIHPNYLREKKNNKKKELTKSILLIRNPCPGSVSFTVAFKNISFLFFSKGFICSSFQLWRQTCSPPIACNPK